jgi:hypothetical protein
MIIDAKEAREKTFLNVEKNKKGVYKGIKNNVFNSIESAITDGKFYIALDFVQTEFIDLALLKVEDELKSLGYFVFVDRTDNETYFGRNNEICFTVEWK